MNAVTKEATALGTAMPDATPNYAMVPRLDSQSIILNGEYFDRVERLATHISKAKGAVPDFLIGNIGACIDVALTAMRAGFNPFGVARKCWMGPNGVIQYEAQLAIALINNSGLLTERLNWVYFGDWQKILGKFERRQTKKKDRDGNLVTDPNGEVKTYIAKKWNDSDEQGLGVRCFATMRGERAPRVTELLMAQAVTRNSTLWVEDPRQQIGYLSGFRWGRLHTPEAIMGIYTNLDPFADRDDEPEAEDVDPMLLRRAEEAAAKGRDAYQAFWKACTNGERADLSEKTKHHDRLKAVSATVSEAKGGRGAPPPPPPPPPASTPPPPASTPAPTTAPTTAPANGPAATPAPTTGPSPAPEPTTAPAPGTPMTYAQVVHRMVTAFEKRDVDLLDVEADWIRDIQDEALRKEATAKYEQLRSELEAGSGT